ncbi:DUF4065 domain-containing protein [Candidatus Peregrinibacteria bacterium]|nr:DUF4065 domain-containing protein [Candidatus Peregrinibacteria bacterium]
MLAQFIQQQRNKHDFSQEYMASALGISRPTYMQIELGGRDITVTEAHKLAEIFGMTLENFLAFNNQKDPKIILEKEKKAPKADMEVRVTRKNLEKFKQVLLYILEKVGSKPNVGETVLNKLLYFIDFDYFEKFEENLMGATYIKNHHGPTPVELKTVVERMKKNGEIEEVKSKYFTHEQKKYLPLKRANLSLLTGQEIEHIDEVLARLSDKNANEISEYSHRDVPWLSRKSGEALSYESVFYRDEKYSVRNYDDAL